jgi:hypothetical protein
VTVEVMEAMMEPVEVSPEPMSHSVASEAMSSAPVAMSQREQIAVSLT